MSMQTLTTAAALLNDSFGQYMTQNLVRPGFIGNMLHPKSAFGRLKLQGRTKTQKGGKPLRTTPHLTDPAGGWFAQGDAFMTAVPSTYAEASQNWARCHVPVHLDRLLVNEVVNGAGIEGVIDPLTDEVDKAMRALVAKIETGIHTTQGAKAIDALDTTIGTNLTVHGIDQVANAYWRSKFADGLGAAFDAAKVETLYRELYNSTRVPTAIWTNQASSDAYAGTLTGNIRYEDLRLGDAKFKALQYAGIPVVEIPNFPTAWYMLDEKNLYLKFLEQNDIIAQEGKSLMNLPNVEGVPAAIVPGNPGTDSILLYLVTYVQFGPEDPSYHGFMNNYTV